LHSETKMKTLKEILDEARMIASAGYRISPSGRKVRRLIRVGDDDYNRADDTDKDGDIDADDEKKLKKMRREEVEQIEEAVSVKKQDYSWGKMVTVHHGADTSYPLHPEHQAAIKKLKDGEHTSFTDETNRKVTAHREGEHVHLSSKGTSKKTTVAHSHFNESVTLEESKWEKTGAAGLAKDFGEHGHISKTKKDITVRAKVHNASHSDGAPVLKNFDRKEKYEVKTVTIPKGSKVVHDKSSGNNYVHHPEHGHVEFEHDDIHKKEGVEYTDDALFESIDYDKIRADAADHLKKSIDKQSDDRIAALKNPKKPESFLSKVGRKQINMVKGAWHGLTKESADKDEDDVPFDKPYKKVKNDIVTDKSGAKHGPMSRARNLARIAAAQQQKKAAK
jgi:hypothetical protein